MQSMKLKHLLAVTTFAGTAAFVAAQGPAAVTFVDHDKVAGCSKGGTLVTGPDHLVQCSNRTGPGVVEVHLKETDVMYFIDGSATLVTGGTTVNAKAGANPLQIRGTDIQGGKLDRSPRAMWSSFRQECLTGSRKFRSRSAITLSK